MVSPKVYGNPSSLHMKGVEAEKIMEEARKNIADALGADPDGLYFTSGGTEANNLAVIGGALAKKRRGNKIVVSVLLRKKRRKTFLQKKKRHRLLRKSLSQRKRHRTLMRLSLLSILPRRKCLQLHIQMPV